MIQRHRFLDRAPGVLSQSIRLSRILQQAGDGFSKRGRIGRRAIKSMVGVKRNEPGLSFRNSELPNRVLLLRFRVQEDRIHLSMQRPEKWTLLPRRNSVPDQDVSRPAPKGSEQACERNAYVFA